jgi:hypothetical protein
MRLLDDFATQADVGFQSTHGKLQRRRDPGGSRSQKQFGMGWSQAAVATARHIVTIRCMANDIHDGNWQQCFARAVVLESEWVSVGVINPATPKPELLAHLIGVRRQLRENLQGSDGCKWLPSRARRALSRSRNASELQRSGKSTPLWNDHVGRPSRQSQWE